MLSTIFGSDKTHLLSTAEQHEHHLACVEVALFAVPIEERFMSNLMRQNPFGSAFQNHTRLHWLDTAVKNPL